MRAKCSIHDRGRSGRTRRFFDVASLAQNTMHKVKLQVGWKITVSLRGAASAG